MYIDTMQSVQIRHSYIFNIYTTTQCNVQHAHPSACTHTHTARSNTPLTTTTYTTTTQCKLQSTPHTIIYTPSLASIFLQYIGRYYMCLLILVTTTIRFSRYNQTSQSAKSLKVCPPILDQHMLGSLLSCAAPPVNKRPTDIFFMQYSFSHTSH